MKGKLSGEPVKQLSFIDRTRTNDWMDLGLGLKEKFQLVALKFRLNLSRQLCFINKTCTDDQVSFLLA